MNESKLRSRRFWQRCLLHGGIGDIEKAAARGTLVLTKPTPRQRNTESSPVVIIYAGKPVQDRAKQRSILNDLDRFIGGQIEIQNDVERYLYRGEISDIHLGDSELTVRLTWMAKGECHPLPTRWVVDDIKLYCISLGIYVASNIGPSGGDVGGGDRICLCSDIVHEITILYPADGSKLDPAKVEGLEIPE